MLGKKAGCEMHRRRISQPAALFFEKMIVGDSIC